MAFHSFNNSNCVTLLFLVSHFKVFSSLVVGHWSSVQLPAPALPASAQQQHAEVPPGSDCGGGSLTCCRYFLVLGLSDWSPRRFRKPFRKESAHHHCGTQQLQDGSFLSLLSPNLYLHVPRAVWQVAEEGVSVRINQWCPVRIHIEEPWGLPY